MVMNGTYRYDYSKTLWMKIFLAKPDFANNRSEVYIDLEQALSIIKAVDAITQGIQKIVYLVGWQGLGHDDCYPEMHHINPFLKRECDATARDSLLWLIEEGKKYHTVVSVHGNLADEYADNASHAEIVAADAIVKHKNGEPAVIEAFYGRDCYKISFKQYYESGLFRKYWDKFCETLPIKELGTVHLDNFCVAENLYTGTGVEEQSEGRAKIIEAIQAMGIDVTSEYTYREQPLRAESIEHPIVAYYRANGETVEEKDWTTQPIRILGKIAASWWTSGMTPQDCIEIPPSLYSGHLTDPALFAVFYGAMHGEDIWFEHGADVKQWAAPFIREFCTCQLPYLYLNRLERLSIRLDEDGENYIAAFSDGVESIGKSGTITKNGKAIKQQNDLMLPLWEDGSGYIGYSENGRSGEWYLPDASFEQAEVYQITAEGNRYLKRVELKEKTLNLTVEPGCAVYLKGI